MSSRQEEKAARRAEREAKEAAAAKAAARGKRVRTVVGGVLVLAILAGSGFALAGRDGGGDGGSKGEVSEGGVDEKVAIPPVKEADLKKAIAASNCVQVDPENEGSTHVEGKVEYRASPPTSGNHNATPSEDGNYKSGNEPAPENWIHSLEHGRIIVQYKPGTPQATIDQLETVASEELNGNEAYHTLVMQNNTKMSYAVAAVAWDHILGCETMNPQVFDAIRAFRKEYTDKGPELVP